MEKISFLQAHQISNPLSSLRFNFHRTFTDERSNRELCEEIISAIQFKKHFLVSFSYLITKILIAFRRNNDMCIFPYEGRSYNRMDPRSHCF